MEKAEEWIFLRLHELELVADGYRFLMRTMTDKDWKGLSRMIDMAGFSKEKFEEDYLLKKINPFVPRDSGVKMEKDKKHKVRDMRSLVTMRDQLEDFLDRWEDFFDEIVLSIIQVSNVGNVLNKLGVLRCAKRRDLRQLSDYLRDEDRFYENSPQATDPPADGKDDNQHKDSPPATKKNVDQKTPVKTQRVAKKTNSTKAANNLSSDADCSGTLASPRNPDNSQISTEDERLADTPDSGMVSDVADKKPRGNKKPDNPELWTGRDGRRYRKNKEKAAKLAMEQAKLENHTEEKVDVPEPVLSGKQKRRMKDKLRKERKTASIARMSDVESLVDSESSIVEANEPEIITPIKTVSIEDKPPQVEKQIVNIREVFNGSVVQTIDTVVDEQTIIVADEKTISDVDEKTITDVDEKIIPVVDQKTITVAEEPISEDSEDHVSSVVAKLIDDVVNEQEDTVAKQQSEDEIQVGDVSNDIVPEDPFTCTTKELTKKQMKRAKKRANKENNKKVYSSKKTDTVESSPGESQTVKADKQEPADNVPWKSLDFSADLEKAVQEVQACYTDDGDQNYMDVGKYSGYQKDFDAVKARLDFLYKHDDAIERAMRGTGFRPVPIAPEKPELDVEAVRKILADPNEEKKEANPSQQVVSDESDSQDGSLDDLQLFLKNEDPSALVFRSKFAQLTASLFVRNAQFKEFCQKYSTSKFSNEQAHKLITRIINDRIIYYYEQYQRNADKEARRLAKSWTNFNESSPYLLMVMMFMNIVTNNVAFFEFEALLFLNDNPV